MLVRTRPANTQPTPDRQPRQARDVWSPKGVRAPAINWRRMQPNDVLDLYRKTGALLEGHFRLTSGLHSERYLQSAVVLQFPEYAAALGESIATTTRYLRPTVVLSPAL